jgi:hypothetical protein
MERKKPISFENAIRLANENWKEAFRAGELEKCNYYHDHFIEWISEMGHHIELTGDEFEPYLLAQRVS